MRKLFVILLIFCFSCKQNESNLILEYEKMAKNDIEKDSVKLFKEIKNYLNSSIACITSEEPPPTNSIDFFGFCDERFIPI